MDNTWHFPGPAASPAILILKVDSRKLLRTIEHAELPAWSPDGSKLAFIQTGPQDEMNLRVADCRGQRFTVSRPLIAVSRIKMTPFWTGEGRSIFVAVEKSNGLRMPELDLARVFLETNESLRVLSFASADVIRRGAPIRGLAIDFDRQQERCFFAADVEGRESELVSSVPRDRVTEKRFHPIDGGLRVGSLAVSPDGRFLAMRFGPPSMLSLPAIHDLMTDQTILVIPDEAARGSWLALLSLKARALLLNGLPPVNVEGDIALRPTLLPLPGELPVPHPLHGRIARLARFGSAACNLPIRRNGDPGEPDVGPATTPEDRLFFDYLKGDFAAAASDLDAVEPRLVSPQERLSLLSLRAQVLSSRGEVGAAKGIIDYLIAAEGGPVHRVEDTPSGPILTAEPASGRIWARYLASKTRSRDSLSPSDPPDEPSADHLPAPFVPPDPIEFQRERGTGPMPFDPRPRRGFP